MFSKKRNRLLTSEVEQQFFTAVNEKAKRFASDEHFTVGDRGNFHDRQALQRDPLVDHRPRHAAVQLLQESKLAHLGHALVENRNGLRRARGRSAMLADKQQGRSWARTRPTARQRFRNCRAALNVTPHITKNNTGGRSSMDGRTIRHAGYAISLSCRRMVEMPFAWLKQTA